MDDEERDDIEQAHSERGLMAPLRFSGLLSALDERIDVTFHAHIREDGEVELQFDRFARTPETFKLEQAWGAARRAMLYFNVEGVSDDGIDFASEGVFFSCWNYKRNGEDGHSYAPTAKMTECFFRRALAQPAPKPVLRMSLKGVQCFPAPLAECRLGRVAMAGPADLKDADKITGHFLIEAADGIDHGAAWRAEAEELLQHLRRMMSFASGVILLNPVTEFFEADRVEVRCRSQVRQNHPSMRVFHYLNFEPIFEASVRSFDSPRFRPRDLLVALEWFAMPTTYNEVRLFNMMTALENLTDVFLTPAERRTLGAHQFKKLEKKLRAAIKDSSTPWSDGAADSLLAKLGELKRKPLREKLALLFEKWTVPLDGINEEDIQTVIKARNDIVHSGFHDYADDAPDLWHKFTVARELFVRLMLAALDYRGQYISMIGEHRLTTFPPEATPTSATQSAAEASA